MKSLKEDSTEIHSLNSIRPWYFGNIYFVKQLSEELYLLICLSYPTHISTIFFKFLFLNFLLLLITELATQIKTTIQDKVGDIPRTLPRGRLLFVSPCSFTAPKDPTHQGIFLVRMGGWQEEMEDFIKISLCVFLFYHHHLPP